MPFKVFILNKYCPKEPKVRLQCEALNKKHEKVCFFEYSKY